jgi:hypothetical protein
MLMFLFCFFQLVGQIDQEIEETRECCKNHNVSLQPFIIVVGPLENPTCYYIVVAEVRYLFPAQTLFIEVLDTCYKIFFALQAQFPPVCKDIWIFIQRQIYGMPLGKVNCPAQVSVLMSSLRTQT